MLHKKIQATIGLIEDVVDNRQKENDNKTVADGNSTFFESFDKLILSIISYIFIRRNLNFVLQPDTSDNLQYLMDYAKNAFESSKAVNPRSFKQKADSFVNNIQQEWIVFYKSSNSELLNGLNIIVLVNSSQIVKDCLKVLKDCEKFPLTKEKIDNYKKAKETADKLMKEMHFDDEIKEFLVKVRDKKATLTDLTPSILNWIKEEDISDKVCLSIRNT